jgi:hypothetical protein
MSAIGGTDPLLVNGVPKGAAPLYRGGVGPAAGSVTAATCEWKPQRDMALCILRDRSQRRRDSLAVPPNARVAAVDAGRRSPRVHMQRPEVALESPARLVGQS